MSRIPITAPLASAAVGQPVAYVEDIEGAQSAQDVADAIGAIPDASELARGLFTPAHLVTLTGAASTAYADSAAMAQAAANWAVTDWYLDAVNGSDANSGLEGNPLQSIEELSRRLAIVIPTNHNVRVWIAQGTYGSLFIQASLIGASTRLSFLGITTVELATTVATYTTYSHTTKSATHLSLVGVADLTPYIGRRIRRVSDNSVSFVGATNHESLGASIASIAPPYNLTTGATVVWLPSDAVVIETLPSVQIVEGRSFTSRTNEKSVWFESLNLTQSFSFECVGAIPATYLFGCSITAAIQASVQPIGYAYGCFYDPYPGKGYDSGLYLLNTVVRASTLMPFTCRGVTRVIALRTGFVPPTTGSAVNIGDSQFFDSTRVAVEPGQGAIVTLATGFSCRNVYCAFRIGYNTRIKYLSTIVVGISYTDTGSVIIRQNDGARTLPFYLSGTTEQVWSSLTDYHDGYQRGQSTVGSGGFVDVTCKNPTDFTLQNVRVSCPSVTTIQPYAPLAERVSYQPPPALVNGTFRIYGEVGKVVEWEITATNHNIFFSNY